MRSIVPTRLFFEIVTDTVWFLKTSYLTQYSILDVINSNHVVYQALTVKCFSGLEFQRAAKIWVKLIFNYYIVTPFSITKPNLSTLQRINFIFTESQGARKRYELLKV